MSNLTAEKFVEMVDTERRNRWQNSDLMNETERRLEIISDHYKICEECADLFNVSGYESETLMDFVRESNFENTNLSDWISIKTEKIVKKLTGLDANDVLDILTFEEVPEGYRSEVWVGESGMNYFVGSDGILGDDGEEYTVEGQ